MKLEEIYTSSHWDTMCTRYTSLSFPSFLYSVNFFFVPRVMKSVQISPHWSKAMGRAKNMLLLALCSICKNVYRRAVCADARVKSEWAKPDSLLNPMFTYGCCIVYKVL